jgi:hypothetical protein
MPRRKNPEIVTTIALRDSGLDGISSVDPAEHDFRLALAGKPVGAEVNEGRQPRTKSQGRRTGRRPSRIPYGAWPCRMAADLAAGYCGETTVEAFIKRVRSGEYPQPRVKEGRRLLWLKDDLDAAILPPELKPLRDIAGDL